MLQPCTSSPHPPLRCSRLTWPLPSLPRSTSPARLRGRAGSRSNPVRFSIILGGGPATRVYAGPALGSCGGVKIGTESFPLLNPRFWSLCRVLISPKRFPPRKSWLLQGGRIWLTLLSMREGGLRLDGNRTAGTVELAVLKIIVAMELTVMRLGLLGFLHIPLLPEQMIQCENFVMMMRLFFCLLLFLVPCFPLSRVCAYLEFSCGKLYLSVCGRFEGRIWALESWIWQQDSCRLDEMEEWLGCLWQKNIGEV